MNKSFICELLPTLTGPSNNPKEPVSFYAEFFRGGYKLHGVSASGVLKEGELKFSEKNKNLLMGSFYENGVEVKVSLELALFDANFVMGAGVWSEFDSSEGVRQKYNAKIWGRELSGLESSFLVGMLERLERLQEGLDEVRSQEKELSENYDSLESKVEDAINSSEEVIDNKDDFDAILANFQEAEKECGELLEKLEQEREKVESELSRLQKGNNAAEKLSKDFESIRKSSAETQEKADKALSSSITVQLARSFKIRKDDAIAMRVKCDRWFGVAILVAIVISVSFILLATFFGTGGASYFEYMVSRVPVLIFPVWFAVFFAKKSSAASRLEEFYAHKQALAESYEGYSQEVRKISGDNPDEELSALMAINLVSIGKDSASIWDEALKEKHSLLDSVVGDKLDTLIKGMKMRRSAGDEKNEGV